MQHKVFRAHIDNSNRRQVECWAANREMLLDHVRYLFPYQDIMDNNGEEDVFLTLCHPADRSPLKKGDLVFIANDQPANQTCAEANLARIVSAAASGVRTVDTRGDTVNSSTYTIDILRCELTHAMFKMPQYGDGTEKHQVRIIGQRTVRREQILKRALITLGCINMNAVLNIARV